MKRLLFALLFMIVLSVVALAETVIEVKVNGLVVHTIILENDSDVVTCQPVITPPPVQVYPAP